MQHKPEVFVCASAIGYYGDKGEHECIESAEPGATFLSDVCKDWEEATAPAAEAGRRDGILSKGGDQPSLTSCISSSRSDTRSNRIRGTWAGGSSSIQKLFTTS